MATKQSPKRPRGRPPKRPAKRPATTDLDDVLRIEDVLPPNEFVVHQNGQVRQAGAEALDGATVQRQRTTCERSLYAFTSGILGRRYLHPPLHVPVCTWLQRRPPYRKMLLLPRRHAKTSIVSHGLPAHIIIQPASHNIYFQTPAATAANPEPQGRSGSDIRITLACETADRSERHIRVLETIFESNQLFRAFWPSVVWERPKAQSRQWNQQGFIVPRPHEYPEPTVQGIGVGGTITGARLDCIIKDDLISVEAANSPAVMQTAIDWHIASRALFEADWSLEFVIGTRWAVWDLYQHIIDNDPSVELMVREITEGGQPIYPTHFSNEPADGKQYIAQLKREFGVLFPLLYQNRATDPELTDFEPSDMRYWKPEDEGMMTLLTADERDILLDDRLNNPRKVKMPEHGITTDDYRGLTLTDDTYDSMKARYGYLNFKSG
jgi:hypothetical protein